MILTDVHQVALFYHSPQQVNLHRMTVSQARQHIAEGHFASGSMLPKVTAGVRFVEGGGEFAIIANLEEAVAALRDRAGTRIVRG